MTDDRRKHPRVVPGEADGGQLPGNRHGRRREPAAAHFRHLRDTRDCRAAPPEPAGGK